MVEQSQHFKTFMFHAVVQQGFQEDNLLLFPTVKEFLKLVNS